MGVYYADRPTDAMSVAKKMWRPVSCDRPGRLRYAGSRMKSPAAMMSTKTHSPEGLLRMPDEGVGFELIAGELREWNKTVWCSLIAGNVLTELANAAGDSGWTVGCGVGFQCFADQTTV